VVLDSSYPAVPDGLREIRDAVELLARDCGLRGREAGGMVLAVSEAAANAIVHGYRGDEGVIRVRARREDGELMVVVADDGRGFVPRTDSPGLGLGLPIIANVALRMEVVSEGTGTEVHIVFPCPGCAGEVGAR
jgi:anti-sigma regulatory factor (Ser/Thr protein kinase)